MFQVLVSMVDKKLSRSWQKAVWNTAKLSFISGMIIFPPQLKLGPFTNALASLLPRKLSFNFDFSLSDARHQQNQHRSSQHRPPGAERGSRRAWIRVLEGAARGRVDAHVGQRFGDPVQELGCVSSALEIAHFLHAVQERLLGAATHKRQLH